MRNSSYKKFNEGRKKNSKNAQQGTTLLSLICTFAVIVLLACFFPNKGKAVNTSKNHAREIQVSMYQANLESF